MFTDHSSFENLTDSASKYLVDIGRSKQTVEIQQFPLQKRTITVRFRYTAKKIKNAKSLAFN